MASYYATHQKYVKQAERALARLEPVPGVIADLVSDGVDHDTAVAIIAEVRRLRHRALDANDAADVRAASIAHASESLRMIDNLGDKLAALEIDADDETWTRTMQLARATTALVGARRVVARDAIVAAIPRDVRMSSEGRTDDEARAAIERAMR